MDRIQVTGGIPLEGEVTVQGSKNAALPLMAAAVLNEGRTVLCNCPQILDVAYMSRMLRQLGCRVAWEDHTLIIDAADMRNGQVPATYATCLRASVLLMGSLLGRFHRADLPYPGGCTIGSRPVDLHLKALERLGARVQAQRERICLTAERLTAQEITLAFPSVGATENAILAAVKASGTTVLRGAAREPEITQLCGCLNSMGAQIETESGGEIRITGVDHLGDCEYTLMPDRIVAGTYLLAAAGTRGQICLHGAEAAHLEALTERLRSLGAVVCIGREEITIDAAYADRPLADTKTGIYPGFPTDLQSPLMAVLCKAKGTSRIEETLFENRFVVAEQLRRMGAQIELCGEAEAVSNAAGRHSTAVITGTAQLYGAAVRACELRGGAALVTAGLMAQGDTVIDGNRYIQRGYEDICRDLRSLGADIRTID